MRTRNWAPAVEAPSLNHQTDSEALIFPYFENGLQFNKPILGENMGNQYVFIYYLLYAKVAIELGS